MAVRCLGIGLAEHNPVVCCAVQVTYLADPYRPMIVEIVGAPRVGGASHLMSVCSQQEKKRPMRSLRRGPELALRHRTNVRKFEVLRIFAGFKPRVARRLFAGVCDECSCINLVVICVTFLND